MQSQFLSRCAILLATVFWLPGAALSQQEKPESLIGKRVFLKDHVRLKVDGQQVDPELDLPFPETVREVMKDRVRIGRIWIKRADVMTLDEAIPYYTERLTENPKSLRALRGRATCYLLKEEFKRAKADLALAAKLAPADPRTINCLGDAEYNQKRCAEAIRFFDQAIEAEPESVAPRLNRAYTLAVMEEYDKAIEDLEEILRLHPNCDQALRDLASVHTYRRRYDEAIEDYNALLEVHPTEGALWRKRGWVWVFLNRADRAEEDFNEAIARNPDDAAAFSARAGLRLLKKDFSRCLEDVENAIRIDPNHAESHHLRAMCLLSFNDPKAASVALDESIRLSPQNTKYLFTRAMLLYGEKKSEAAMKVLDEILRIEPGDVQASMMRAYYMQSEEHNLSGALSLMKTAIAKHPQSGELYHLRSKLYYDAGDFNAALIEIERALKLAPKKARWVGERGIIKYCAGDYAGATKDFNAALSSDPTLDLAMQYQLLLLTTCPDKKFRNADAAKELLAKLLTIDKDSSYTNVGRACILALQGKYEAAAELQRRTLEDADYADDKRPLLGAADAQERIAAWKEGKLWTSRR